MELLLPLDLSTLVGPIGEILVVIAIGIGFGFVLERAGFGDSRNLAAQFYFHDMRVFKVMFTAIIVAMVLIFFTSSIQLLDFSRLWVNPTYFGSGVTGGFILGLGFIIGGYCPGTSIVAVATLKLDGLFFLIGVLLGLFVFGETVMWIWPFFNGSGAAGRYTMADWLGVDPGIITFGIVMVALICFVIVEKVEAKFSNKSQEAE